MKSMIYGQQILNKKPYVALQLKAMTQMNCAKRTQRKKQCKIELLCLEKERQKELTRRKVKIILVIKPHYFSQ